MQWYEIMIIVLACVFVVGVMAWRIIRNMQGKGGCDCGCGCGGNCDSCKSRQEEKK